VSSSSRQVDELRPEPDTTRRTDLGQLLGDCVVFVGPVVDALSLIASLQVLLLAAEDRERDTQLYINSPGGSVTAGVAIPTP
jgi:ATP-dependent protease ClpP protease subunit